MLLSSSSAIHTLATPRMATSRLPRLLKRQCQVATTFSLRPLHALSSFHHLYSSSFPADGLNPKPNPSINHSPSHANSVENETNFAFSSYSFAVYPTFPHFCHLGPVTLLEGSKDCSVEAQSTSLTTPNYAFYLKFEREPKSRLSVAHLSDLDLDPISEDVGLEIEREKEVVIRADSVKKKRKRKMNKHKLRKLRKKLRRKT